MTAQLFILRILDKSSYPANDGRIIVFKENFVSYMRFYVAWLQQFVLFFTFFYLFASILFVSHVSVKICLKFSFCHNGRAIWRVL